MTNLCNRLANWWTGLSVEPPSPDAVKAPEPKPDPATVPYTREWAEAEVEQRNVEGRKAFEKAKAEWAAFDTAGYKPIGEIKQHIGGTFLCCDDLVVPTKFIEAIDGVEGSVTFNNLYVREILKEPKFLPAYAHYDRRPGSIVWEGTSDRYSAYGWQILHPAPAKVCIRMSSGRTETIECSHRVLEMQVDHLRNLWQHGVAA
jgi:hypothetical protein